MTAWNLEIFKTLKCSPRRKVYVIRFFLKEGKTGKHNCVTQYLFAINQGGAQGL